MGRRSRHRRGGAHHVIVVIGVIIVVLVLRRMWGMGMMMTEIVVEQLGRGRRLVDKGMGMGLVTAVVQLRSQKGIAGQMSRREML